MTTPGPLASAQGPASEHRPAGEQPCPEQSSPPPHVAQEEADGEEDGALAHHDADASGGAWAQFHGACSPSGEPNQMMMTMPRSTPIQDRDSRKSPAARSANPLHAR